MKKIIFFNLDLLRMDLASLQFCREFRHYMDQLCIDKDNLIYFISRNALHLSDAEKALKREGFSKFHYKLRSEVKSFVTQNQQRNNYFVFVSGKDVDFFQAVNSRSLFIVPTWIRIR